MGSQACWNAEHAAPKMIAVRIDGKWHLAEREEFGTTQPDQCGGGSGPAVVSYAVVKGARPYHSRDAAHEDAALMLKRLEKEL